MSLGKHWLIDIATGKRWSCLLNSNGHLPWDLPRAATVAIFRILTIFVPILTVLVWLLQPLVYFVEVGL